MRFALLLEHGCEKTHNDYFRAALGGTGRASSDFGWASIQVRARRAARGNSVAHARRTLVTRAHARTAPHTCAHARLG